LEETKLARTLVLKHNLLSISQFCDNGYDVLFIKNNCTVINTHDKSIVCKGKRRNNVYKINFSELTDQKVLCLLSMSDKKWLWHRRLGHDNLSEAYQTLTIIQMHSVVHVRREKLLRLLSNQKTLFLLPDLWNYFKLIYLDQLALHPYMGVNMEWL